MRMRRHATRLSVLLELLICKEAPGERPQEQCSVQFMKRIKLICCPCTAFIHILCIEHVV